MTSSPLYTITAPVSHGGRVIVYRAVRNADHRPVMLKVLGSRHSRPKDLEQLKREYEIGKLLDTPAVIKVLAFDTHQGAPALVMEDFGGRSLDGLLGAPMAMGSFLPLALAIARATASVHQQGVIHKDLKPDNILVNPASGEVKLTDFGLASRLPREHQPPQPPRLIEGSLAYMSPEQTGRMNRALDNRTDLYSLGVTFYQMLTGRLPFEARDPVEWVHCHVARPAPSPSELVPAVPEPIARIVLKLLSKMPEDRYQSARGLSLDLERCLEQWSASGRIEPFALGERDATERLQIPQKLYGREAEIALLLEAFGRVVATGRAELLLVSGYSGIGKSVLVQELYQPSVRDRGFFVSGKFDRYKRDIPYATIVQAFRDLVLEILAESEERIAALRQQLLSALGINGQLIVDVIPPVELIIGRQPPAPELPPAEAQNRFHRVFRLFIGVFAQKEQPLALFLDDLQWADSASLGLLKELVAHSEVRHLLVLGAYRDNEVSPSHPLLLTLDEVRKAGARISNIVLGPIPHEHLAAFVSEALHCCLEEAAPLADLIYEKTAGNPFFAIQFLTALYEERLIEFDGSAGAFRWDVGKIRAKGFTDNVVDLMVGKLRRLPAATTQEALKQLACLGNSAEVALLAMVRGASEEDTHADLWEAVRAGLVLRSDSTYKFLHDRVQEAAYSLIPEEQRAEVHLGIGRLLLSRLPEEVVAERVFDVANQWNHGAHLLTNPQEKETLSRLNLLAGRRAKAAIAYASARSYLTQAASLLLPSAWSARYEETFTLYLELSECEYLVGNFQRADELFDLILQNARYNLDRARAYRLRMRLYQVSGRYADGLTVAFEALRLFEVSLPESDGEIQAAVEAEIQEISAALRGRRIADILDAPVVDDVDVRMLITLLVESISVAYTTRPQFFPLLTTKAVNLSLKYGNSAESCQAYTAYATMLVSLFGDIPAAFELSEMSLQLNERFDDRKLRGRLLEIHGKHINHWRKHFSTDLYFLRGAFLACLEVGDLVFAGYAAYQYVWQVVEKGDPLDEVLRVSQEYAAFAKESHNDAIHDTIRLEQQLVRSLKGLTREPTSFDDDDFDEAACLAAITKATFGLGIIFYHVMKQTTAFIHGRYAEALESGQRASATLHHAMALSIATTHDFYFALTLAALYPEASATRQRELAQTLALELEKHKRWAESCPENYLNRYALVSAEVARIEGRDLDAMRGYEEAIRSARDNGFVHNEAIAYETAARFYRARGFELIADTYLGEARARYLRWGADGKVRQLERLHPQIIERKPLPPAATLVMRTEQLDLLSVTKASQTISGEIVLDKLVRTLLEVVLEQGGAQSAYLILCRDKSLSIEAEAALEEQGPATSILGSVPVDSSRRVPASLVHYVQRTRERVILSDAAADAGKFSGDDYFARARPRSVLCIPILRQTEMVGLLYLENNLLAGAFTPERLAALELLATQAAISLENALLLAKERAARAAAEDAGRRTAFVAEAGALLSESLDVEETFTRLGRLCVRSLADHCLIDIVEGREIRRLAVAHADPTKEVPLKELQRRYPPRWDSPHPAATVLRTGEPLLMPELPDDVLRSTCEDDEHMRLLRELGTQTGLAVPLVARGQMLGVLTLSSAAPGRRYGRADLELAQDVASRAAIAIDNARLYRASQDAVRARSEFLTVASHELNTPITSLVLALQSLRRAAPAGRPLDARATDKLLELASRQGARLARLVDDLLDVSRIDAGAPPLELSVVELRSLGHEVVERFAADLARSQCSISLTGGAPVVGRWDRSRIDRVVTNLLSNAIKFGPGQPIEVLVSAERGVARLAIRDHGIGIDPAQRARIFGRFERAVSERHYGGLGLGLYISRRIVEDHGGSIRCESLPGAGATFTVELPCSGPREPDTGSAGARAS